MNTIKIFIECIKNTAVFSRVRSTSENFNVFIIRDENMYGTIYEKNSLKHGNNKNLPGTPYFGNGPVRIPKAEESIRLKWINLKKKKV